MTIGLLSLVGLFYGYRFAAKAYAIANPVTEILPLPASHIGVNTEEGARLLKTGIRDDYVQLASVFKAQQYRSYCGVATGVMTVNALLGPTTVDQDNWFSDAVATHRSQWDTFFGGMTLAEFSGMLASFGLNSKHHHGGQGTLDDFRALVRKNLADKQDVLVVNYSRKSLEQKGWGHFSPLAAYHPETDRVLILDVGAHKYEPSWVKLEKLWSAMATRDSDSGKNRGYVVVYRQKS